MSLLKVVVVIFMSIGYSHAHGISSVAQCPRLSKTSLSSTTESITLTSPGYPREVPSSLYCSYTISSPPGTRLSISCDEFVLSCSKRYYLFVSISNEDKYQVCGELGSLPTIETKSNVLRLRLSLGATSVRVPGRVQVPMFGSLRGVPPSGTASKYRCHVRISGSSSSSPAEQIPAPVTSAPAVSTPATSAPAISAPVTSTPALSTPALSTPATSAPAVSAPVTSAPAVSTPATSAPAVSAPATSAPAVSTAAVSTPVAPVPVTPAPVEAVRPVNSARPSPQNGQCSCGVRNINGLSRIVGGSKTKTNEIPWRVPVFIYNPSNSTGKRCAGTIISPSWILTAAHCIANMTPETQILIFVGAQDDPIRQFNWIWTKIVSDRYVQHPGYESRSKKDDIALVHLPIPLSFDDRVSPACLPFKYTSSDFSGETVLASGWGTTEPVQKGKENTFRGSDTLLKVDLGVVTSTQCQRYYSGVTENQICTYSPGRDTCQGDSGSSVDLTGSDGFMYAIGVVSFGAGCAQEETPGVNTKVTKYLDWIQRHTEGETFCVK